MKGALGFIIDESVCVRQVSCKKREGKNTCELGCGRDVVRGHRVHQRAHLDERFARNGC